MLRARQHKEVMHLIRISRRSCCPAGERCCGNREQSGKCSLSSGLCAERTTLFYANSQYPDQAVKTLAIAARTEQDFLDTPIPPCGACRQVLLETEKRFGKPMRILLYSKSDIYIMEGVSALLPLSFDGDYLTTN